MGRGRKDETVRALQSFFFWQQKHIHSIIITHREWPEAVRRYKNNIQTNTYDLPKPKMFSEQEVFAYTSSVSDWEEAVDSIEYIEKSKIPGLVVYINW